MIYYSASLGVPREIIEAVSRIRIRLNQDSLAEAHLTLFPPGLCVDEECEDQLIDSLRTICDRHGSFIVEPIGTSFITRTNSWQVKVVRSEHLRSLHKDLFASSQEYLSFEKKFRFTLPHITVLKGTYSEESEKIIQDSYHWSGEFIATQVHLWKLPYASWQAPIKTATFPLWG